MSAVAQASTSSAHTHAPLGKHLASTDKKTRDKAIQGLTEFLSDAGNSKLSERDMDRLWKGIFYCFWHSDKPLVQQALATDLANILLSIPSVDAALAFLRGFWAALVREWAGIDRLRLDKYYMLIRRYVNASFRLLLRTGWEPSACARYNEILSGEGGPLYPTDSKVPLSLQYHLVDVYLPELDKVLASFPEGEAPAPLLTILHPFFLLATQTPSTITFKRVESVVIEPLLSSLATASTALSSSTSQSQSHSQSISAPEPARKRQKTSASAPSKDGTAPAPPTAATTAASSQVDMDIPLAHIVTRSLASGLPPTPTSSEVAPARPETQTQTPARPAQVRAAVLRGLFEMASREETRDANRRRVYAICKAARDDGEE